MKKIHIDKECENKKNITYINNKKGISLVILIVTIIITLILATIGIINVGGGIANAGRVALANDLLKVEEGVKNYYIKNSSFPIIDSTTVLSQEQLISLASLNVQNKSELISELEENLDNNIDETLGEFYQIDLAKIDVTKSSRGTKKNGQENDVYVLSASSMKVYYLKGEKYDKVTYFSLTKALSSATELKGVEVSYITKTVAGVTVKTASKTWTNKMGVNIDASIASDEKLYMSISGGIEKIIVTSEGINSFSFDSLAKIILNQENITVNTITNEEVVAFDTLDQSNKYIEIIKKKNNVEIGRIKIDLSNYENIAPVVGEDVTFTPGQEANVVKFSITDTISKIKEVRYEYLTEFDSDAKIINSYNVTDFEVSYLSSKGKKASIINGVVQLNLPKNIKSVQVLALDNAGNGNRFNVNNTSPALYVGVIPEILSLTRAKFKVALNSDKGISTVKTYLSINGAAYSNEKIYTLNTDQIINFIYCDDYKNIAGASDSISIKVVATDNKTVDKNSDTIVLNFKSTDKELNGAIIGTITTSNSTINGENPTYNNPIIPIGFKALNTTDSNWGDDKSLPIGWNDGLVIEDLSGNQFVWVPVDGTDVAYSKWCTTGLISYPVTSNDTLPSGITNEIDQITKYGGFYIARYEAMFDYNKGNIRVASQKSVGVSTTSWTRDNTHTGYLWNFVNYTDAKLYSEKMNQSYAYDTTKILTNLVTGTEWDTVMKWIQNSGKSITDSRPWGNYNDSIIPANITGYGVLQISGFSEYWKAKNIYDLAGNTWELTNEKYNTDIVGRGSSHNYSGLNYSAAFRYNAPISTAHNHQTFRVALYIK